MLLYRGRLKLSRPETVRQRRASLEIIVGHGGTTRRRRRFLAFLSGESLRTLDRDAIRRKRRISGTLTMISECTCHILTRKIDRQNYPLSPLITTSCS